MKYLLTENITISQQLVIFNQWIVGKQLFQITIMCDYGYRSTGQLDSQRSIPDPKRGNVTSTPQSFTFGPQFLVVQTKTFIDENFVSPGNRLVFSRFLDLCGNLGIVKEKPTRKTCFSHEKKRLAPRIYASLRCFFEVNGISIIFSQEIRC